MATYNLRPWEVNQLTWPQVMPLLGWSNVSSDAPKSEPMTWGDVEALYRAERQKIYELMAKAAQCEVSALVELPIDEAEALYLQVSGKASVDRLQMRACMTRDLLPPKPNGI